MIFSGHEKRQFRALARMFAGRFLDTEIIQARGDFLPLFAQVAALLAALSLVVCLIVAQAYIRGNPSAPASWGQEEFLISTTMAAIGIFTLLLWDSLFPDRHDSLILGAMPVRVRTLLCAKIAAIGTALTFAIVAVNSFTGIVFPLFILPAGLDATAVIRCFAVYWLVIVLASVFASATLLAVQGIMVLLLPHAGFQRWSALVQCGAFFAVLSLYFLAPPTATPNALANPGNLDWYAVLPSYWFLGLFQVLNGSPEPLVAKLAHRAVVGVAAVTLLAAVCYLLAYARRMRCMVEQQGISPHGADTLRRAMDGVLKLVSPHPEEHALLAFAGRTLARSRQHRSLIAIYAGMGLAYVFSGAAGIIYNPHSYTVAERARAAIGIPLPMLFLLIAGVRVSFSIPIEVRANWLFRMSDSFGSGAYLSAAYKALLLYAVVPVLAISAVIYGVLWPWWRAAAHLGFLATLGLLLVELALHGWDKIPFTCTYLPGSANLKVMFGVYWLLLWALSQVVVFAEGAALETPAGYAVLMVLIVAGWRIAAHRTSAAKASIVGLRFEDTADPTVTSLGNIVGERRTETGQPGENRNQDRNRLVAVVGPQAPVAPVGDDARRRTGILRTWGQDIRYALRLWRKAPGFTAVALLVLATGIGANTIVFTTANAILFKNLPFKNSDRIFYLQGAPRVLTFSYPDFLDLRTQVRTFKDLAAYEYANVNLSDELGTPTRYRAMRMSANGLSVMEQVPIMGRAFLPEDEQPGAVPVAMLTYDLWRSRYGQDSRAIGRSISLNEVPTIVVGVTPPGVRFAGSNDLWMPLVRTGRTARRDDRHLMIFGMLADGATRKRADAEIATVMMRLSQAYPQTNNGIGARVKTLSESHLPGRVTMLFTALIGAVVFVLLIACANVANLLLVRAIGRSRELSIRAALGASRTRVLRQLLAESGLLALAGGTLGWVFAIWGSRAFGAALTRLGGNFDFSMDRTVFVYLGGVSLLSAILFGLAPALRASKTDLHGALKEGSAGSGIGFRNRGLSGLLVSAEVAFAVVLVAGAGLMIRSILNISRLQIGVNTTNVLTMRVDLPGGKYQRPEDRISFYARLKTSLDNLPGVESVALTSDLPGNGWIRDASYRYEAEGVSPGTEGQQRETTAMVVSSDYFRVMQVHPAIGREFLDSDRAAGNLVAIVNQSLAASIWSHSNPLGRRIRIEGAPASSGWRTVVGVVRDILQNDFSQREPRLYVPYRQEAQLPVFLVARTAVPPGMLGPAFRRAVQDLDRNLPVYDVRSLDEHVALHHLDMRMFTAIFSAFAGIALLLASIGLYAVVAHSVRQRTHELGVRIALGASTMRICGLVLGRGMSQLAAGLAVGVLLALSVTRVLGTLLIGAQSDDPLTLFLTIAVLTAAGALGCSVPVRRAVRVDPMAALRNE